MILRVVDLFFLVWSSYGEIKDVWLDGAKGIGEKDMDYYFENWFELIHQLQPGATIFSDAGPDSRWVGDEAGVSSSTCWAPFNRSAVTIGGDNDNQLILLSLSSFFLLFMHFHLSMLKI